MQRGDANEYAGTTQGCGRSRVAVYLSLLGPHGMRELGQTIMQRSQYAAQRLGAIPGVRAPALTAPFFKEFVGRPERHRADGRRGQPGARGGRHPRPARPLRRTSRTLGQSALVCVTEIHTQADIDRLADAIAAAVA